MFNNWINGSEAADILHRFRTDELFRNNLLSRFHITHNERIKANWTHTDGVPSHWWDIPEVQRRWNKMISGDPEIGYYEYIARRYFRNARHWRGLSLGCGGGGKEREWARTGTFTRIDAFDLSPHRIQAAKNALRNTPEEKLISYKVADVLRHSWDPGSYDVVFFDQSLHHFSPLTSLLQRVSDALTPEGYLLVNEYVGPSRFQWTEEQLSAVDEVLKQFPEKYRAYFGTTYAKRRELRPSKLRMRLSDPSEAVESSQIVPMLRAMFDVVEFKGYGGALLHLLFSGIAHHFITPDKTAEQLLDLAFAVEDKLLASGTINHDFAVVICTPKKSEMTSQHRVSTGT